MKISGSSLLALIVCGFAFGCSTDGTRVGSTPHVNRIEVRINKNDKVPADLIRSTEYLFTPIKEQLTRQSDPAWTIALYEHFVRAGEVIIARQLGNKAQAEHILKDNATNGFIYLPAIVRELETYAAGRRHPGYDEFVPAVIERLKSAPAAKN